MTIAFLLGDYDQIESIDAEAIKDCCESASLQSKAPFSHSSPWIQPCDQNEVAKRLFNTPLLPTDFAQNSKGHCLPQAGSFESVDRIIYSNSGCASSTGTESSDYNSSNPSSNSSTSFYGPSSGPGHHGSHHHHRCYDRSVQASKLPETSKRNPRSARPSYNEERMFLIMHRRVVKELSWPGVENEFAKFFELRSKPGLTSVYYRIRQDWGMEKVLKSRVHKANDLRVIERKAAHFSRTFLESIGYFIHRE
ncbi:hypothetical protein Q7P35_006602 [Cladosporium inversicolor]